MEFFLGRRRLSRGCESRRITLPLNKEAFVGDTYLQFRHGGLAEYNNEHEIVALKPGSGNPGVLLSLMDTKSNKRQDFRIVWPSEEKLFNHLEFKIEKIEPNGDAIIAWSYLHKRDYLSKHPKR